jgi:hypothetical protein
MDIDSLVFNFVKSARKAGLEKRQEIACTKMITIEPPALGKNSGLFRPYVLFNGHVFELAGFKNIATFLAFNKFSVFFARDNAHAGMLAGFLHRYWCGRPLRDRWVLG